MVEELGESGVPYSPLIIDTALKGKQPFQPTFLEWLWKRGEQVVVFGNTGTVYTVPENYILFLTNLAHNGCGDGGVGAVSSTNLSIEPGGLVVSSISLNRSSITGVARSFSFSIPLKITAGQRLGLSASGGISDSATIIGFLIKKDQVPQI